MRTAQCLRTVIANATKCPLIKQESSYAHSQLLTAWPGDCQVFLKSRPVLLAGPAHVVKVIKILLFSKKEVSSFSS